VSRANPNSQVVEPRKTLGFVLITLTFGVAVFYIIASGKLSFLAFGSWCSCSV